MGKLILYPIIFLFAVGSISGIYGQELEISGDIDYEELNVHEGVKFKVHIEGRGWYLNRYDKEHISFTRRFLEPSHTSFDLFAKKSGRAYLLFSYLDKDVYVMVNIDHTPVAVEPASSEITPSDDISSELSPSDKSLSEVISSDETPTEAHEKEIETDKSAMERSPIKKRTMDKSPIDKSTADERPLVREPKEAESKEEQKKESEIYYMDKEKKIVPVPFKGEDDQYKKGIRFFERGEYDKAENAFAAYLENCESCRYRVEAVMKLAEAYLALGKKQEAGLFFEKVINFRREQYMKKALIKRGDIFYDDDDLESAVNYYQRALEYSRDDLRLLRRVVDIHYALNHYKKALDGYEKLRESGQTDDEILFRIATIYDSPAGPRDIQKAYKYYKVIIDKFSLSKHFQFAKKRVKFMEKNFFDYK